jgi:hypothetical protein
VKKVFLIMISCFLLAGCGASRPVPDWLRISSTQLETYKINYLSGKDKIAAAQFKSILGEIRKSGDLEVLARAHLTRMALQTSVLETREDGEYLKISALSPSVQNSNFYAFLKGDVGKVDENLLPAQYTGFYRSLRTDAVCASCFQEVEKIEDPLSRLIAAGVLVQFRPPDERVLKKAIDTASAEGWKKALLVYLERLQAYHESRKETQAACNIEGRIKLIRDQP